MAPALASFLIALGVVAQTLTPGGRLMRSVEVVDYRHRSFPTMIALRGTAVLPEAQGFVGFVGKLGDLDLNGGFTGLSPASNFGPEYLTYVVWAITPEGRPVNIAEILVEGTNARLVAPSGKSKVTTNLKTFGMIVTAEPYFAVTTPSDVVVMENKQPPGANGGIEDSEVKYELLPRRYYVGNVDRAEAQPVVTDPEVAFEILEARHAIQIARWFGADRYAPETFGVATLLLRQAEIEQGRKKFNPKLVMNTAREAVETAEDARVFALTRKGRERAHN